MRRGCRDSSRVQSVDDRLEIIGIRGEAQVFDPFRPGAAVDRPPPMRMTERVEVDSVAGATNVEPEGVVAIDGLVEVRNAECEAVKRMDGGCAGAARRGSVR